MLVKSIDSSSDSPGALKGVRLNIINLLVKNMYDGIIWFLQCYEFVPANELHIKALIDSHQRTIGVIVFRDDLDVGFMKPSRLPS
jgi:hypothetical protein